MRLFSLFPLKQRAVFISFDGKQYSCNPKAIFVALHEVSDMQQYWIFCDIHTPVPPYVRAVKKGSLKSLYLLATSRYWVDNFLKPSYYRTRKHQVYIQTWHGECGLKKLLEDADVLINHNEEKYRFDYATTGSTFGEEYVFRHCFGHNGAFLRYGCPRNDRLVRRAEFEEQAQALKQQLGIPADCNLLIYAPTFRDSRVGLSEHITLPFSPDHILGHLSRLTGKKWGLIYRGHLVTGDIMTLPSCEYPCYDLSSYQDMADLLLIGDLLVTDYSSCCTDFILSGRPTVLLHQDWQSYDTGDRELIFPEEKNPFRIAHDETELCDILTALLTQEDIAAYCDSIKRFYGSYESGHAAERIAEKMRDNTL